MKRSRPAHARGATSPGTVALTIRAASSKDRAMSITLPAESDQPLPCRDCRAYSHAIRQILRPCLRPPRAGSSSPACLRISSISFWYLSDILNPQAEPYPHSYPLRSKATTGFVHKHWPGTQIPLTVATVGLTRSSFDSRSIQSWKQPDLRVETMPRDRVSHTAVQLNRKQDSEGVSSFDLPAAFFCICSRRDIINVANVLQGAVLEGYAARGCRLPDSPPHRA